MKLREPLKTGPYFGKVVSLAEILATWSRSWLLCNYLQNKYLASVFLFLLGFGPVACTSGDARSAVDATLGDGAVRALVASVRSEPRTFNRLVAVESASSLVAELTHASLVRLNKHEDTIEPWLAESWSESEDGLSFELQLRRDVRFSDGVSFTSEDVVFSFAAVYDDAVGSPMADTLRVGGRPLAVEAIGEHRVRVTYPEPFSPGLRMLSSLPMLPRHLLREALASGSFAEAWGLATPLDGIAGLGPFVLARYESGQRLTFTRNPHYWRRDESGVQLPRLDQLTLEIVPDQDTEMLRFAAGAIDFTQGGVRAEDYRALRLAQQEGRAQLIDLGVALDADFLLFNLKPTAMAGDPRRDWLQADDFRRAVAHAVDREAFAETVYLGLGEAVHGPVTRSNERWYHPDVVTYDYDVERSRQRLASLGLRDRDHDGYLEDARGNDARFTLLTQRGHSERERAASVIAEDLAQVGIAVDVVPMEFSALVQRLTSSDFDAIYLGYEASDTDPASNLDLWLSSAAFHFWNPGQVSPETQWEARIDALMREQVATSDEAERKRLFDEVQQIFAEYVPALYFAAPRIVVALSPRVTHAQPAGPKPFVLWSADTLGADGGSAGAR